VALGRRLRPHSGGYNMVYGQVAEAFGVHFNERSALCFVWNAAGQLGEADT